MSALVTLLDKTGTAGTTGANTNALPAADGADGKSNTSHEGLHLHNVYEVAFTRVTQDGTFAVEGTLDGTNYSRLMFRRMDLGTEHNTLTLAATTRVMICPTGPTDSMRIRGVRFSCWLAGAGAAGDRFVVTTLEGR
jgi:hypothetical protein